MQVEKEIWWEQWRGFLYDRSAREMGTKIDWGNWTDLVVVRVVVREGNHIPWRLVEPAHVRLQHLGSWSVRRKQQRRELRVLTDPHLLQHQDIQNTYRYTDIQIYNTHREREGETQIKACLGFSFWFWLGLFWDFPFYFLSLSRSFSHFLSSGLGVGLEGGFADLTELDNQGFLNFLLLSRPFICFV